MSKAWNGSIFSESAEAAFWQTLSLPPLLLGLLGSLGFLGDWFGDEVVRQAHDKIIGFSETIFSDSVVTQIITPTVNNILTTGKGEIVSVGFLISLWAGSSAMASFVDAITVAHDQSGVRHEVWQRLFALLLYVGSLILLVVGLPVIAIGPDLLPEFFPQRWQPTIASWLSVLYYPTVGVLLVLALATLYKLALPRKLPWHRGLPGAVLAMGIFLLSSVGLRFYISWITTTGYTYGALATPIAFLLFTFFIGLAIITGAYFNSAIEELWPARMTRRQRRRWRRLEMERYRERTRARVSDDAPGAPRFGGGDEPDAESRGPAPREVTKPRSAVRDADRPSATSAVPRQSARSASDRADPPPAPGGAGHTERGDRPGGHSSSSPPPGGRPS